MEAHVYAQVGLNLHLPIYISHTAEMTGMHHHTQLLRRQETGGSQFEASPDK
jgi:hypothetical protein